MPTTRLTIDLAFECDDAGRLAKPAAQSAFDALLAAVAIARAHAVWTSADEDTTVAARHVCNHADGGSCTAAVEVGTKPVRRVAVAKVAAGGEVVR